MKVFHLFGIALLAALLCSRSEKGEAHITTRPNPPEERTEIWLGPQWLLNPTWQAADYMDMFKPNAPWERAAAHTHVFLFYAQFLTHATPDEVTKVVADLKRRHIAIALQVGVINVPHDPPSGCGGLGNLEGYGTVEQARKLSEIIKSAGGWIDYIAMDEPFYYGHYFTSLEGKGVGCQSPVSQVVSLSTPTLNEYIRQFPGIVIGDTEPTILTEKSPAWRNDYLAWAQGISQALGRPLAFLQLDVQWPLPNGKQANGVNDALALYAYAQDLTRQRLLGKIGIIYDGNSPPFDTTDATWCEDAKKHLMQMEVGYKLRPGQAIFQSWMPNPTHVMPDNSPDTLTGLIEFYTNRARTVTPGPITHRSPSLR